MKNYSFYNIVICAYACAAMALLSSCSDDPIIPDTPRQDSTVKVKLVFPVISMAESEVSRSGESCTRAIPDMEIGASEGSRRTSRAEEGDESQAVDDSYRYGVGLTEEQENRIEDITFYQYYGNGNCIISQYVPLLYDDVDSLGNHVRVAECSMVISQGSQVHVLANCGDRVSTLSTTNYSNQYSLNLTECMEQTDYLLPMYGRATNLDMTPDENGDVRISVNLRRLVGKMVLTIKDSPGVNYQISEAEIDNVIKNSYPGAATNRLNGDPNSHRPKVFSKRIDDEGKTLLVSYIPENAPSSLGSSNSWDNRSYKTAPATATYVLIDGVLKRSNSSTYAAYMIHFAAENNEPRNYNLLGNSKYILSATVKGTNLNDNRVLPGIDLSAMGQESANCYVAKAGGGNLYFRWRGNVRGNGAFTPAEISPTGKDLPKGDRFEFSSAETVWQSVLLNSPSVGFIDKVYKQGCYIVVKVKSGTTYGNAVIAAKSGTATKWAWHFWLNPGFDRDHIPVVRYRTIPKTGNGVFNADEHDYYMMDINMGAMNNTPVAAGSANAWYTYGLFYQWGRPMPFPGLMKGTTFQTVLPAMNIRTSDVMAPSTASSNSSRLATYVANPGKRIYNASNYNVWVANDSRFVIWGAPKFTSTKDLIFAEVNDSYDNQSWTKTIYDPCPYGFRVPAQDVYTALESGATLSNTWNADVTGKINKAKTFANSKLVYNGFIFHPNETSDETFLSETGSISIDNVIATPNGQAIYFSDSYLKYSSSGLTMFQVVFTSKQKTLRCTITSGNYDIRHASVVRSLRGMVFPDEYITHHP